jgi:hypothetical protein
MNMLATEYQRLQAEHAETVATRDALLALLRTFSTDGECWCAYAHGLGTIHSAQCQSVRAVMRRARKQA